MNNPEQVLDRLHEIAVQRRAQSVHANGGFFPETVCLADFDFLTSAEHEEMHQAFLELPTFAEERAAARKRIAERIAKRKASHELQ